MPFRPASLLLSRQENTGLSDILFCYLQLNNESRAIAMDNRTIQWKDEYSIGDPTIDAQHKKLISMITEIDDLNHSSAEWLLQQVLDYTHYHFKSEEAYMRKIGYPNLDRHIDEHKKLSETLANYKKDYDSNKINLFAFKNFLFLWVRNHILDQDIKIGRYIKHNNPNPV